jgi:hypothetical protein
MVNQEPPKVQPAQEQTGPDPDVIHSLSGCLIRMAWMVYGLVLFMLSIVMVALQGKGWGGVADIAFGVILLFCLGARMLDHPGVSPSRRKYAMRMVVGGAIFWGLAHLIGNLLLA